jgi:hypothetical protein
MDEHYSKDEKVPQIDLEVFANAHIQKLEEKQFQQDMLKLQAEVDFLEEGKCLNISIVKCCGFALRLHGLHVQRATHFA